MPVPDPNTRIEGAVSGQFDYADALPVEAFDRLKGQKNMQPVLLKPFGWPVFVMNTKQGVMANHDARTAVRMALSEEDMLAAAFGSKEFYSLNAAMYPKGYIWYTTAGTEGALQRRRPREGEGAPEEGELRRKAAAHPDEPAIRVPLQDGAGGGRVPEAGRFCRGHAGGRLGDADQRRTDPALWDIYITHSPFLPEPALIGLLSESAPGLVVDAHAQEGSSTPSTREPIRRSAPRSGRMCRRRSTPRARASRSATSTLSRRSRKKLDGRRAGPVALFLERDLKA